MARNSTSPLLERQLQQSLVFEAQIAGCFVHHWEGRLHRLGPVVRQHRTECLHCDAWSPTALTQLEARGWAQGHGASHTASRVMAQAVPA